MKYAKTLYCSLEADKVIPIHLFLIFCQSINVSLWYSSKSRQAIIWSVNSVSWPECWKWLNADKESKNACHTSSEHTYFETNNFLWTRSNAFVLQMLLHTINFFIMFALEFCFWQRSAFLKSNLDYVGNNNNCCDEKANFFSGYGL